MGLSYEWIRITFISRTTWLDIALCLLQFAHKAAGQNRTKEIPQLTSAFYMTTKPRKRTESHGLARPREGCMYIIRSFQATRLEQDSR